MFGDCLHLQPPESDFGLWLQALRSADLAPSCPDMCCHCKEENRYKVQGHHSSGANMMQGDDLAQSHRHPARRVVIHLHGNRYGNGSQYGPMGMYIGE